MRDETDFRTDCEVQVTDHGSVDPGALVRGGILRPAGPLGRSALRRAGITR